MSGFLLALISFGVVLVPLIIIHELGHFIAAKSAGITVLEFGVGIPPRAATLFERGGTEYTLNWVPLGGFVRPYGEGFMSPKDEEGFSADLAEVRAKNIENPKSVLEAGPWQRIWFFSAGAIFNFIAAFVLFVIMAALGFPQIVDGNVAFVEILKGSPAEEAGLQVGDIVTHVDGKRVITAAEFDDEISGREDVIELSILRDNEPLTVSVVPSDDFEVDKDLTRVVIVDVLKDSPADKAGLLIDDVFLKASDGEKTIEITDLEQLQDFTSSHESKSVTFTVQRGSQVIEETMVPEDIGGQVRIGITITIAEPDASLGVLVATTDRETEIVPAKNIGEAFKVGADRFLLMGELIVRAPVDIINGNIPLNQARPLSPVAISKAGGQSIEQSQEEGNPFPIIGFAAIISIALGVTNLLPIPALDGGRILFVVIELLRGKPVSPEREGFVHLLGFMFLFSLIILLVVLDIFKPVI